MTRMVFWTHEDVCVLLLEQTSECMSTVGAQLLRWKIDQELYIFTVTRVGFKLNMQSVFDSSVTNLVFDFMSSICYVHFISKIVYLKVIISIFIPYAFFSANLFSVFLQFQCLFLNYCPQPCELEDENA